VANFRLADLGTSRCCPSVPLGRILSFLAAGSRGNGLRNGNSHRHDGAFFLFDSPVDPHFVVLPTSDPEILGIRAVHRRSPDRISISYLRVVLESVALPAWFPAALVFRQKIREGLGGVSLGLVWDKRISTGYRYLNCRRPDPPSRSPRRFLLDGLYSFGSLRRM